MTDISQLAAVLRTVAADCEEDARRVDSTAFTPRGVGEVFGATLAMIGAASGLLRRPKALIAAEIDRLERGAA